MGVILWESKEKVEILGFCGITQEEGGLGFGSIKSILKSFRMKASWNVLNLNATWAEFMRTGHIKNQFARTSLVKATSIVVWNRIWKCLAQLVDLSNREVGPGNISLLHENWTGDCCLANTIQIASNMITVGEATSRNSNYKEYHNIRQSFFTHHIS